MFQCTSFATNQQTNQQNHMKNMTGIHNRMPSRPLLAVALLSTASFFYAPGQASAATIQVDFNDAATAPGATWNTIATNTASFDLNDTTSTDSGINLAATGFNDTSTTVAQNGAYETVSPNLDTPFNNAADDYFWMGSGIIATVTLSGVAAGTYNFELFSSRNTTAGKFSDYTIKGDASDNANSTGFDAFADGFTNGEFMVWNSVTANGTEDIVISVTTASGTPRAYFNGFTMTAVPEPSSTALLGLGGLALILRRRR